jgi:quercetin dioxygenase-like cupin family protein
MSQFDSGDMRIRTMELSEGQTVPSHKHNFHHTTYINKGAVRLEMPDETVVVRASDERNWKLIPAAIEHLIVALEDGTRVHCLYPIIAERGEAGFW